MRRLHTRAHKHQESALSIASICLNESSLYTQTCPQLSKNRTGDDDYQVAPSAWSKQALRNVVNSVSVALDPTIKTPAAPSMPCIATEAPILERPLVHLKLMLGLYMDV